MITQIKKSKIDKGGGVIEHRITVIGQSCIKGSHEYKVNQVYMTQQIASQPDMFLTNGKPFDSLTMEFVGDHWEIVTKTTEREP
jgi:hypothetical protein